ncbi:hypothetical protein EG103P3_00044 [Enterococcus phage EG103P3]|nr:hypothetical protein EG103P3_00044 [Enterococcus phage EG103P3]
MTLDKIHLTKEILVLIDIPEYLQRYDCWENAKFTDERLICSSPFRPDSSPSFFVNFNNEFAGTWGDSGSGDSGNFIKLVSLLDETGYEEALDKLRDEFMLGAYDTPQISVGVTATQSRDSFRKVPWNKSLYLLSRGISEATQEAYETSEGDDFIRLPYVDGVGEWRAIKYRKTFSKDFFYEAGNNHIKDLVFGHRVIYKENPTTLAICEAEIDALTAYEGGFVGISLGSANLSDTQIRLIQKFGVENILIASDNDLKGNMVAEDIRKAFTKTHNVYRVVLPDGEDLNGYWQKFRKLPSINLISKHSELNFRKVYF